MKIVIYNSAVSFLAYKNRFRYLLYCLLSFGRFFGNYSADVMLFPLFKQYVN